MSEIDRSAPDAEYVQLAAIIRGQVDSGELPRGSRLPSIIDLASRYGLAPVTVSKAIGVLKAEGLVVTSPGRGSFIKR